VEAVPPVQLGRHLGQAVDLLAEDDAAGEIDWSVSIDSTINRAHQHAATLPRDTGGTTELHESARRAG
jgi:hypothetical protein